MPWASGDNLTSTALNNTSGLVFNVKDADYGAVGDGVTDDTAAFSTCATAALAVGGAIYIPPGKFNITTLTLNPTQASVYNYAAPVVVYGCGPDSQINITNTDGSPGLYLVLSGYFPGFLLRDFTLYGNEACGDGIWVDNSHHGGLIQGVRTLAFPKTGTGSVPIRTDPKTGVSGYAGIRLRNAINTCVSDCVADNVHTGIIIEAGSDACTIRNYTAYGYKRAGVDIVVGQDLTGAYRTAIGVRIIEPYFFGERENDNFSSNYSAPDDSAQGLAADGSDNGRWGIKTEGAPLLHVYGGWYEATEWAIFCGDYGTDLSGVGGDGAGSGAVTTANTSLIIQDPMIGGSYSPKVYLQAPGRGFIRIPQATMALTIGGTGTITKWLAANVTTLNSGDIEGNPSGGFRQTVDGFNVDNIAANQPDTEISRAVGRWRAPRSGSVTGVIVTTSEARTAGTCTIKIFLNTGLAGAAGSRLQLAAGGDSASAQLNSGSTTRTAATMAKDAAIFAAGDELYVTYTTSADWTPTTADLRCALEVET